MALYPAAVKRLIPPGPNDPPIKPRVVILHVAQSEAASLYGYFNGPSGGVESHFYIRRDGTVEQYRDTAWQADANVMANDFAISIETQGMAAGEWTAQQLDAIKALLTWCHDTHGIPLVKCPTWDGSGVGYHILFEAQWDQRGAQCPGPDRIKQFDNVLVPWMATTTAPKEWDEMATKDEIRAVVREELANLPAAVWQHPGLVPGRSIWGEVVTGTNRAQTSVDGIKALAQTLPTDAARAVLDALDKSYNATVELTPKEQA